MSVNLPLCSPSLIWIHGRIPHSRQDFLQWMKRVPMGGTPYSVLSSILSSRDSPPQPASWIIPSKCVAPSFFPHTSLTSLVFQNGCDFGAVLSIDRAFSCVVGPTATSMALAPEKSLLVDLAKKKWHKSAVQLFQNITLERPCGPRLGFRSPSTKNGR